MFSPLDYFWKYVCSCASWVDNSCHKRNCSVYTERHLPAPPCIHHGAPCTASFMGNDLGLVSPRGTAFPSPPRFLPSSLPSSPSPSAPHPSSSSARPQHPDPRAYLLYWLLHPRDPLGKYPHAPHLVPSTFICCVTSLFSEQSAQETDLLSNFPGHGVPQRSQEASGSWPRESVLACYGRCPLRPGQGLVPERWTAYGQGREDAGRDLGSVIRILLCSSSNPSTNAPSKPLRVPQFFRRCWFREAGEGCDLTTLGHECRAGRSM